MELSGSLRRFNVANVFQFLSMETATGVLTLKSGRTRIVISLRDGNPLTAEHTEHTKDQRMGEILIASGRLDKDELDSALDERRSKLLPLGMVLCESRGLISEQERSRLAVLVYTQIIMEALTWRDGVYDFARKDHAEAGEISQPLSMQNILLNAARQEDEWPLIRRNVPTMEAIFSPSSDDMEAWKQAVAELPEDERRLAAKIDGVSTIRMIAGATLTSEFEVARLVSELVRRGQVVRIARPQEEEDLLRPRLSVLSRLSRLAYLPLVVVCSLIILVTFWKNYVYPVLQAPQVAFASFFNAGQSEEIVNRLRLQRLLQGTMLYYKELGIAPISLTSLAEQGFCSREDTLDAHGKPFVLKVVGGEKKRVLISTAQLAKDGQPAQSQGIILP